MSFTNLHFIYSKSYSMSLMDICIISFKHFKNNLFLTVLGLRCCSSFSLVVASYSSCGAEASHCDDFSCCRHGLQGARASAVSVFRFNRCSSRGLEHRLNSCGPQAQLLCNMWDVPRPGIELVSLALAGGLLTSEPSGKPSKHFLPTILRVTSLFLLLNFVLSLSHNYTNL